MKATGVDGVYTADPKRDPLATRLEQLTHREVIERYELTVSFGEVFRFQYMV